MTKWRLTAKENSFQSIDGSAISISPLDERSSTELSQTILRADGREVCLGELFEITSSASQEHEILIQGDLSNVHGLAADHAWGLFRVEGNVGRHLGCRMTGGVVEVTGDGGDFVGAPVDASRIGMRGGCIKVNGDVGDYCGHRMRRGAIVVNGNAGTLVAASMVAGTIVITGQVSDDLAVGMKRGTVLLGSYQCLKDQVEKHSLRFSPPQHFAPGFFSLIPPEWIPSSGFDWTEHDFVRARADRAIAGQGEIICPAD